MPSYQVSCTVPLFLHSRKGYLLVVRLSRYVIKWDVSKGDLGAPLQRIPLVKPEEVRCPRHVAEIQGLTALSWELLGTATGCIAAASLT